MLVRRMNIQSAVRGVQMAPPQLPRCLRAQCFDSDDSGTSTGPHGRGSTDSLLVQTSGKPL